MLNSKPSGKEPGGERKEPQTERKGLPSEEQRPSAQAREQHGMPACPPRRTSGWKGRSRLAPRAARQTTTTHSEAAELRTQTSSHAPCSAAEAFLQLVLLLLLLGKAGFPRPGQPFGRQRLRFVMRSCAGGAPPVRRRRALLRRARRGSRRSRRGERQRLRRRGRRRRRRKAGRARGGGGRGLFPGQATARPSRCGARDTTPAGLLLLLLFFPPPPRGSVMASCWGAEGSLAWRSAQLLLLVASCCGNSALAERSENVHISGSSTGCGDIPEQIKGPSGIITSPGWPLEYPARLNCSWYIQANPGEIITISFQDFDVQGSRRCSSDSLTIGTYKNMENYRVCGSSVPSPYISSQDHVWIRFHSDDIISRKGFRLTYFAGKSSELSCDCNQFHCANGKCVPESWKCNDMDEWNFHCKNNRCVFESWVCDSQDDCGDGSDEENCPVIVPTRVITAAVIGSLICGLLLVIALGCTCKLYSLRMFERRSFETQLSRVEAELLRREAPPSYGQLIAQGLIPPVEDFPVCSPNQASVLENLRLAIKDKGFDSHTVQHIMEYSPLIEMAPVSAVE
ncbi:low-density lipoprotein receptor-related protein 12 [Crotalus adamanteus]|uniref:Low-density lipoprotein receptor-related protein 12 n=1 Tax=Crotalus adamanteus TaxID=8729 RepID=A0AAW1BLW8_CROAD